MLKWYWRVRIYHTNGHYAIAQLATERDLREIDTIKDFYETLTGCKMLLEGMSEQRDEVLNDLLPMFTLLWRHN